MFIGRLTNLIILRRLNERNWKRVALDRNVDASVPKVDEHDRSDGDHREKKDDRTIMKRRHRGKMIECICTRLIFDEETTKSSVTTADATSSYVRADSKKKSNRIHILLVGRRDERCPENLFIHVLEIIDVMSRMRSVERSARSRICSLHMNLIFISSSMRS